MSMEAEVRSWEKVQERMDRVADIVSLGLWPTKGRCYFRIDSVTGLVLVAEQLRGSDPITTWSFPSSWLTSDNWEELAHAYVDRELRLRKEKKEREERTQMDRLLKKYGYQ